MLLLIYALLLRAVDWYSRLDLRPFGKGYTPGIHPYNQHLSR